MNTSSTHTRGSSARQSDNNGCYREEKEKKENPIKKKEKKRRVFKQIIRLVIRYHVSADPISIDSVSINALELMEI